MSKRPRIPKTAESARDLLIDAFISLITDIGAHQVTLQKTAKKAKVPFSTAHYYYGGDWDLIFKDAVQKVGVSAQNQIALYLQKHASPTSDPIELYLNGTFEWIAKFPKHSRLWLFNYYFSSLKKSFIEVQNAIIDNARKRVLTLLYEAKGKGLYPTLTVTPEAAAVVHTIVFGVGIMAIIQSLDEKKIEDFRLQGLTQLKRVLEP